MKVTGEGGAALEGQGDMGWGQRTIYHTGDPWTWIWIWIWIWTWMWMWPETCWLAAFALGQGPAGVSCIWVW